MIDSDKIPYDKSGIDAISKLISDHVFRVAKKQLGPIEEGEILPVWKLDADAIASSARQDHDLVKLAKPTGRWHHQIKSMGRSEAWARTAPLKPGATAGALHRLSASSLARGIERALKTIDSKMTGGRFLRLLEIPTFQLCVLWLVDGSKEESQVLGIEYHPRFIKLDTKQTTSSHEFLAFLREHKPVLGIRSRGRDPKNTGENTR